MVWPYGQCTWTNAHAQMSRKCVVLSSSFGYNYLLIDLSDFQMIEESFGCKWNESRSQVCHNLEIPFAESNI